MKTMWQELDHSHFSYLWWYCIVVERCSDAVTYVLRFVGLTCGKIGLLDGVYEGHRDML